MDLDALQAFVKSARLGGPAQAAATLGRTETAVTRHIELLEEHLGTTLFDRSRNRPLLTPAGQTLLPFAEEALSAWREGVEALHLLKSRHQETLQVAVVGALSRASLAPAVEDLYRRYPGTRVFIHRASSAEVSNWVRDGKAALGLRYGEDTTSQLASRVIAQEEFVVVVAADHPLARRVSLPVSALARERWVACLGARGCQEVFLNIIAKQLSTAGLAGAELTPVSSIAAQKRLVLAGFGVGVMPLGSIAGELRRGVLVALPIPALHIRVPICAVYRRRGLVPIAALRFLELLTRHGLPVLEAAAQPDRLPAPGRGTRAG